MMRHIVVTMFLFVLSASLCAQTTGTPSWKLQYDSAQAFWNKDWGKTITFLSRAERSALNDLGIYDNNYLIIINDLGLAYAQIQDYKNAERLLSKCFNIKVELNTTDDTDFHQSTNNLAAVHASQGHFLQAEELYKRTANAATDDIDPVVHWSAIRNLLLLYEEHNKVETAFEFAKQLKSEYSAAINSRLPEGYEIELVLGRLNRKLRNYDTSGRILETLVRELHSLNDPALISYYIRALQEAAILYSETGFYNKAEKNLLEAFRLLKSNATTENHLLTEVLNTLASVYEKLRIYDKAVVYYQEALELCNTLYGKSSLPAITIQSNIAGIDLSQGNLKNALNNYEAITAALRNKVAESNPFYITVLNNLATAYRKNNDYTKATRALEEAYGLIQKYKMESEDLAATVMNNLAVILTARGEPAKAIALYEKAYAIKRRVYGDNSVLLMDLAGNIGVLYWELHDIKKAIPFFQKSNQIALRQIKYIFPNLNESEQVQFYKRLQEDFERFNSIAFQSASVRPDLLKEVFNNQVTIKSLLFFTQQHRNNLINERKDETLELQHELLKAKREQLGNLYQVSLTELSKGEVSISSLENEIEKLEKAISLKTSETVAEKMMEQKTEWPDIQSKVTADEALIEIIRFRKYDFKTYVENISDRVRFGFTDSIYYAALITTKETVTNPKFVLLKEGRNMETRFLNYYRNALTYNVTDQNSYQCFWQPFESGIHNKSKIYLSGDGVYHRLNLNTLKQPGANQFLLERIDIHYLLNPVQFLEKQTANFTSRKATLMGDPTFDMSDVEQAKTRSDGPLKFSSLPGTNTEIVKINEILRSHSWSCSVYLKKLASERNVKNVHSPDILHIATHGFFATDRVKLSDDAKKNYLFHSGLVLSGANRNLDDVIQETHDDGILTAYEVMNLDLSNTHLVVLSACETGLGKIENGEGVYGLQRSFLQAGARNILISLWKVDDQITQQLMVKFYEYLFKGKSEREALKMAQLDQLRSNPDPMAWGGFIVIGSD